MEINSEPIRYSKDDEQSMKLFWKAVLLLAVCAAIFFLIFLLINPALQHQRMWST
jgi:hypothetical protein